jgi:hypothetical protein
MKSNIILTIVIAVVVGIAGFFGGMQYQRSMRGAGFGGGQGFRGGGQFAQRYGQNAKPVRGQITSIDANSMTVKMNDGSSTIVLLSGSTNITKAAQGSKDDLKTGAQVMAIGTSNSDGSITAQLVQLNPGGMMGR